MLGISPSTADIVSLIDDPPAHHDPQAAKGPVYVAKQPEAEPLTHRQYPSRICATEPGKSSANSSACDGAGPRQGIVRLTQT